MSATAPTGAGTLDIRLDRLFIPDNIRRVDDETIDALQRSIQARGKVVVPIVVTDADPAVHGHAYDFVLVAGFRRTLASQRLGHETIPGVYGDAEHEHADRALENVVRKQLNPYEEATAVRAMLDSGYTEQGAAEVLGWDKRRVTARIKLLELPERAQQLVGDGTIPLAAVEPMRVIAKASPPLLDTVVAHIDERPDSHHAGRLAEEPLSVLERACAGSDAFVAPLHELQLNHVEELEFDDATIALVQEAVELEKKLSPWSYWTRIPFTDAEVDRARAAGVLIEYGEEVPVVTDRGVYRELCATAIATGVESLKARIAERATRAAEKKAARKDSVPDERSELEADHRRAMREFAASAHAANLDLGTSLRDGLSTVDPSDMTVARFFVYGLLGSDPNNIYYAADTAVGAIAMRGIRLVIGDFREDVTKERKDGSRGALRITYGDGRSGSNQTHWLWKYLDGADTAGELYGRALVVIAAERYASRLVVPGSQRRHPLDWPSHKDQALKALEKLAKPHVAATLKALEKAIARAEREHHAQLEALRAAQAAGGNAAGGAGMDPYDGEEDDLDDGSFEGEDYFEDERDAAEPAAEPDLDGASAAEASPPEPAPPADLALSSSVIEDLPGHAGEPTSDSDGPHDQTAETSAPDTADAGGVADEPPGSDGIVDASEEIPF